MAENPRILTIGSATLDLFIGGTRPPLAEIELKPDKKALVLEEGTKLEIVDLTGIPGGGATNAARVISRFGLPVTAFFKTANDQIAEKITTALRNDGVDIRPAINTATGITGLSVIVPAPSGNKTILSYRGANDTIEATELPFFFMRGMDGVYVAPLAGQTAELLPKIAEETHKNTSILMHNPSTFQLTDGRRTFLSALKNIDILLLNSSEGKILLDGLTSDGIDIKIAPKSNLNSISMGTLSVFDLLVTIRALGPHIVLVTDGSGGIYAADRSGLFFCPSVPTHVINTVGAGDTFGATFFGAYLSGYDMQTALQFGAINSSQLLGSTKGVDAILNAKELEKMVNATPR